MTKKKTASKRGKRKPEVTKEVKRPSEKQEDLVVFAFRLRPEERALIHKAAGPAKASRFVRTLVVAAASGDEKTVREMVQSVGAGT